MFSDRQSRNEKVVLLDVAGNAGKSVGVDFCAIQISLARYFQLARISKRQAVQERRLSSTTSTHNCQKLPRSDDTGHFWEGNIFLYVM